MSDILRRRPYSDLTDLLTKVPSLHSGQALEMLCKAGALESFGASPAEIMSTLSDHLNRAKKISKEGTYQINLFEESPETGAAPEAAGTPKSGAQLGNELFFEHEAIGCFATGSPMDDFKDIITEFCGENIAQVTSRQPPPSQDSHRAPSPGVTVVAGMLTSCRSHVDRFGRSMGFAKIEDGSGSLEIVLFHDIYEKNIPLLKPGIPLLVRGRLEKRGLSATLIAEQIVGIDQPERLYESILIKLDPGMGVDVMRKIRDALKDYPGDRPVHIEMTESGGAYEFRAGSSCRPTTALRRKLESILGPYSVFFLKSRDESLLS